MRLLYSKPTYRFIDELNHEGKRDVSLHKCSIPIACSYFKVSNLNTFCLYISNTVSTYCSIALPNLPYLAKQTGHFLEDVLLCILQSFFSKSLVSQYWVVDLLLAAKVVRNHFYPFKVAYLLQRKNKYIILGLISKNIG